MNKPVSSHYVAEACARMMVQALVAPERIKSQVEEIKECIIQAEWRFILYRLLFEVITHPSQSQVRAFLALNVKYLRGLDPEGFFPHDKIFDSCVDRGGGSLKLARLLAQIESLL